MTTTIYYTTHATAYVYMKDGTQYATEFYNCPLDTLISWADFILTDPCSDFQAERIDHIYFTDSTTGELLLECRPDEEDFNCDWDYNEDEGFDPYLGCYTDDC